MFHRSHRLAAIAAAAGLTVAGLAVLPAEAAAPKLRITKVYVNSPGSDTGGNASVNGEYVKIKNKGKNAVSLSGYSLRDESNHVYYFGSFKLKPGKTVTVYSGRGSNSSTKRYIGSGWYIWNNTGGDSATLRSATGAKVDSCSWGNVGSYVTC